MLFCSPHVLRQLLLRRGSYPADASHDDASLPLTTSTAPLLVGEEAVTVTACRATFLGAVAGWLPSPMDRLEVMAGAAVVVTLLGLCSAVYLVNYFVGYAYSVPAMLLRGERRRAHLAAYEAYKMHRAAYAAAMRPEAKTAAMAAATVPVDDGLITTKANKVDSFKKLLENCVHGFFLTGHPCTKGSDSCEDLNGFYAVHGEYAGYPLYRRTHDAFGNSQPWIYRTGCAMYFMAESTTGCQLMRWCLTAHYSVKVAFRGEYHAFWKPQAPAQDARVPIGTSVWRIWHSGSWKDCSINLNPLNRDAVHENLAQRRRDEVLGWLLCLPVVCLFWPLFWPSMLSRWMLDAMSSYLPFSHSPKAQMTGSLATIVLLIRFLAYERINSTIVLLENWNAGTRTFGGCDCAPFSYNGEMQIGEGCAQIIFHGMPLSIRSSVWAEASKLLPAVERDGLYITTRPINFGWCDVEPGCLNAHNSTDVYDGWDLCETLPQVDWSWSLMVLFIAVGEAALEAMLSNFRLVFDSYHVLEAMLSNVWYWFDSYHAYLMVKMVSFISLIFDFGENAVVGVMLAMRGPVAMALNAMGIFLFGLAEYAVVFMMFVIKGLSTSAFFALCAVHFVWTVYIMWALHGCMHIIWTYASVIRFWLLIRIPGDVLIGNLLYRRWQRCCRHYELTRNFCAQQHFADAITANECLAANDWNLQSSLGPSCSLEQWTTLTAEDVNSIMKTFRASRQLDMTLIQNEYKCSTMTSMAMKQIVHRCKAHLQMTVGEKRPQVTAFVPKLPSWLTASTGRPSYLGNICPEIVVVVFAGAKITFEARKRACVAHKELKTRQDYIRHLVKISADHELLSEYVIERDIARHAFVDAVTRFAEIMADGGHLATRVQAATMHNNDEYHGWQDVQRQLNEFEIYADQCRPWLDSRPNIEELRQSEESMMDSKESLQVAVARFERADNRDGLVQTPKAKRTHAQQQLERCRWMYRKACKDVYHIMAELVILSAEHFPELPKLYPAAKIGRFRGMEGLQKPGLSLQSYSDVRPLKVASRNSVFTATLDGEPCVLKAYDVTSGTSLERVEHEVLRLHKLQHGNIIKLEAYFVEKEGASIRAYLQMPFCDGGNMQQWLKRGAPDPETRKRLVLGLLQAIERVHSAGISHNDIKLQNVLLTGTPTHPINAILSDFELSRSTDGNTVTAIGGTPAYSAPEHINGDFKPSPTADMYSLGVLLLLTFCPDLIERVESQAITVRDAIMDPQVDEQLKVEAYGLRSLLTALLSKDPKARVTVAELLSSPFLKTLSTRLEQEVDTRVAIAKQQFEQQLAEKQAEAERRVQSAQQAVKQAHDAAARAKDDADRRVAKQREQEAKTHAAKAMRLKQEADMRVAEARNAAQRQMTARLREPLRTTITELDVSCGKWSELQARVQQSLPRHIVTKLQQIDNNELLIDFERQKEIIAAKPANAFRRGTDENNRANIRLCFHGMAGGPDELKKIYEGGRADGGFDYRLGRAGAYGRGSYFAEHAIYSAYMYPRPTKAADGSIVLLVAEVILGQSKDLGRGTDRTLVREPPIDGGAAGDVYDSVQGTEGSFGIHGPPGLHHPRQDAKKYGRNPQGEEEYGRQYIVYDKAKAYPRYLVTIRPK